MNLALEEEHKIVKFSGLRYIAKTVDTKGYQGFKGLGWYGHAMMPLDVAFEASCAQSLKMIDKNIVQSVLNNPNLFSKAIQVIPAEAEKIQNDLDRTVWNGNVLPEENSLETSSSASKFLLWEISKMGIKTKNVFENSIRNLHETVVSTYLNDVQFLASLAIDIMDRNLYERANDCRWWALTSDFRNILKKSEITSGDLQKIESILVYINDLYTVYTNLFIYNKLGNVIAVSNPDEKQLVEQTVNGKWVTEALNIKDSQRYSVSSFDKTHLYNDRHTYTYNAAITDIEDPNTVLGGIGIVFDSEPEFNEMLTDSLPRQKGELIDDCFGVFTDKNGMIISSTNENLSVGEKLEIDASFYQRSNEPSLSKISVFDVHYYAIGIQASNGYREYKSAQDTYQNEVYSFVFMKLDKVRNLEELNLEDSKYKKQSSDSQHIPKEEFSEVATFYIDNSWYGIKVEHVIEAIEFSKVSDIPGTPNSIVGTMFYNEDPLLVLNPSELLETNLNLDAENIQIIVMRTSYGNVGIAVGSLGEIPKYENYRLDRDPGIISESNKFITAMVKPEANEQQNDMLIILDPDGLIFHITGEELAAELV